MSDKLKAICFTVVGIALGVSIGLLRGAVNVYIVYLLLLCVAIYAYAAGYYTGLKSKGPKRPK